MFTKKIFSRCFGFGFGVDVGVGVGALLRFVSSAPASVPLTETIQRRWIIGLKDVSHPESQQVNFLLP